MVHVNEILEVALKKRITSLETPMELLFMYELDKYLLEFCGEKLALDGIVIPKSLEGTQLFSFVVMNGLQAKYNQEKLVDYSNTKFFKSKVRTKNGKGIVFVEETDDIVVYSYSHSVMDNIIMWGDGRPFSYVSLVAYLCVKGYIENKKMPMLRVDHEDYSAIPFEYSPILILMNYGNRLLKDKVILNLNKNGYYQPEWEAYIMHHRHLGLMEREYSIMEKSNYLKKNFKVGDVVLYYTKKMAGQTDGIGKLVSCYPAIIKSITDTSLFLCYYPLVQTKETYEREMMEANTFLILNNQEPHYYTFDDLKIVEAKENVPLYDVGVEGYSYREKHLIAPLHDLDGSNQYIDGVEDFYNTTETVWLVFNDWGLDFDRHLFLKRYKQYIRKDLLKKFSNEVYKQ